MLTKRGGSRRYIFYRFINIKRARLLPHLTVSVATSYKINFVENSANCKLCENAVSDSASKKLL